MTSTPASRQLSRSSPGPLDVGLEGRDGGGVRVPDDRLRGKVEDRLDRFLAQEGEDEITVAQVTGDVIDVALDPQQLEAAGGVARAIERRDLGPGQEKSPSEPGPGESPSAGDQRPHRAGSSLHTLQGGSPASHRSLSRTASL